MSRRRRIVLIALAALLFLVVSGLLARFLSVENLERDAVLALVRDEARGDAAAVLMRLHACGASCRADVEANAASLRRPGQVQILNQKSATAYSLTGATGKTRVAWRVPGGLPVVQCVLVRRSGNPLTGLSVTLLALSRPIPGQADC